jgi:hypothetical protein
MFHSAYGGDHFIIRPETIWSRDLPRYRVRDPSLMKQGSALEAGKRGFLKIPSHSRPPTALAGLEDLPAQSCAGGSIRSLSALVFRLLPPLPSPPLRPETAALLRGRQRMISNIAQSFVAPKLAEHSISCVKRLPPEKLDLRYKNRI